MQKLTIKLPDEIYDELNNFAEKVQLKPEIIVTIAVVKYLAFVKNNYNFLKN